MRFLVRVITRVGAVLLLLSLAAAAHAYTSSVAVSNVQAAQGSKPVSPYTVKNLHYDLFYLEPENITQVYFDIYLGASGNPFPLPSGSTFQANFGSGAWYPCSNTPIGGDNNLVTCNTASPAALQVGTISEVDVVLAQ